MAQRVQLKLGLLGGLVGVRHLFCHNFHCVQKAFRSFSIASATVVGSKNEAVGIANWHVSKSLCDALIAAQLHPDTLWHPLLAAEQTGDCTHVSCVESRI
jgi:hypothetical protein